MFSCACFIAGMSLADREERDAIESLHDHIAKLKSANSSLATKNKSLIEQLEKKKRELVLAKRAHCAEGPSCRPGHRRGRCSARQNFQK